MGDGNIAYSSSAVLLVVSHRVDLSFLYRTMGTRLVLYLAHFAILLASTVQAAAQWKFMYMNQMRKKPSTMGHVGWKNPKWASMNRAPTHNTAKPMWNNQSPYWKQMSMTMFNGKPATMYGHSMTMYNGNNNNSMNYGMYNGMKNVKPMYKGKGMSKHSKSAMNVQNPCI